jgi:hypothetical protein
MREVARRAGSTDAVELLRAESADACVRIAFVSSAPIVAKVVDENGEVLASAASAAAEGVLGERGPICVRKGEVVRAVGEGAAPGDVTRVRWMAWQAPP